MLRRSFLRTTLLLVAVSLLSPQCARAQPVAAPAATPAAAAAIAYVAASQCNLAVLLPPPPAPDSEGQRRDMDAVLALQRTRTAAQVALAKLDAQETVFRFADVVGPTFTADRFPLTAALFERIFANITVVEEASKAFFNRPRPFAVSDSVQAVLPKSKSGSYPSGHAMVGTAFAIVLAQLLPEKRAAIFARGRQYGDERVLGGVHYPTDVEASRMAATAFVAVMLQNPVYQRDAAAANAEIHSLLGAR